MRHSGLAPRSEYASFIVDRGGRVLGLDPAMERLTGWPALAVVARNGDPGAEPLYQGTIHLDGRRRSLRLSLSCRDGSSVEVDAVSERMPGPDDRTRVTILRTLARSAAPSPRQPGKRHDPATGLLDASSFRRALGHDLTSAARRGKPVALVLADVDGLDARATRGGPDGADRVLRKVAGILRVVGDDEGRLFRVAAERFAILLPESGRGEARRRAAALRATVEHYPFFAGPERTDETLRITLSLGAASFPADAETPEDLVGLAEAALAEARQAGGNRVSCYAKRPRVTLEVPVFFDGVESCPLGVTRDLSPSGIFVRTAAPIDIGMRCALTFPLPGRERPVRVFGRVVRTVPSETPQLEQEVRVPGMAVEFELFGGRSDRRAIEAYLRRSLRDATERETGPAS